MEKMSKLEQLGELYDASVEDFTERFLKSKAEKDESVVYSFSGRIVSMKASEALKLYHKEKKKKK